ncbi:MAG: hypothetical protein ACK4SY_10380, partial [Pyrobaculum sp.]
MHILLEKTLREAASYFQDFFLQVYPTAAIHKIDAGVKLDASIVFVLLAVSTFSLTKLFFLLVSILMLAKALGLSLKK